MPPAGISALPEGAASASSGLASSVPCRAAARRSSPALAGFEDNAYSLRRHPTGAAPSLTSRRKKTRHLPIPTIVVIVVALAGGIGFVGYRIAHPSVHRSPTSVALAFYEALQHHDPHAAAADVEPIQQAAARSALTSSSVTTFAASALGSDVVEAGTTTNNGPDTGVILEICGDTLSCIPALAVPTTEVAGSWYVDLTTWLPTVPIPAS